MSVPAEKLEERFTYAHYLDWPNEERWELIHGVAYDMSPAPSPDHQRIVRRLLVEFDLFLREKTCEVFIAPFDVRLPERNEQDEEIDTVVQPDISVICDPAKIDQRGCRGAPDLVVEILSPATARKDTQDKFALYEAHGVKEYWIVHPFEHLIEVFTPDDQGKYGKPAMYAEDDLLPVALLPGLKLDLGIIFGIEKDERHSTSD